MLRIESLRDLLAVPGVSTQDRLLRLLAVNVTEPKPVNTIRKMGRDAGWRGIDKLNVSAALTRAKGLAIRTPKGWELTSPGRDRVRTTVGSVQGTVVATIAPTLRAHLAGISNADARAFVEEAVHCYEAHLYRAAIVLSWVGAVAVLYNHVVANHLAAFNAEATRRDARWRQATNADDLARMREHDFLEILTAISVPGVGKNVKEELQKSLKLRNACGHPNSLKIGEHTVAAHLEILIMNIFSKF